MTLRAILLAATLGLAAATVVPGSATAVALPGSAAAAAGPQRVCRIEDDRLTELSGLAATPTGYVVVNDGADEASHRRIFFLDRRCAVVRAVKYPSRPRDTEDLAVAADGTVWVADIGDNNLTRTTIALWRLAPGAGKPQLYRLSYPDGPHNAEALLLTPAGVPIVVTKNAGAAALYTPDTALRAGKTTPLRLAGSVTLPLTSTANPFSLPGRLLVTGGAVSPDGRRVVLRTYADAFEFDVPGDDLVRAVTEGTPRTIPLPDEPQGESVAYSPDGNTLLTVSEEAREPPGSGTDLLRYPIPDRPATPSVPPTPSPSPASPSSSAPPAAVVTADRRLPVGALAAGALLAVAAVALLVVTVRRSRRRRG
ncbi:hypothetical protein ACWKSP_31600 [Micromonosporaceae bacterium Da 78-11]